MGKKNTTREKANANRGSKMGRKKIEAVWNSLRKEIDLKQVIYWIGLQATAQEIAGSFRVSVATLDLRLKENLGMTFTELKEALGHGADGKLRLRQMQFELARTNPSMAIWLGKQWLDQKDTIHQETTLKNDNVQIYIPDNGRDSKDKTETE